MAETVLSELINTQLWSLGLSLRTAAERGGITVSTLHRYAQGSDSLPDPETIRLLAKAIKVPVRRVEIAAGCPPLRSRFELPETADRLNPKERRLVLSLVDALLAAHRDGAG